LERALCGRAAPAYSRALYRALPRFALPVSVVAVMVVALAWSAAALACATPDFLGDYPKDEELPWSENVQGVAHDEGHWFFTNQGGLIKLPADFPLNEDPDFVNRPRGEMIRKLEASFIERLLGIQEYPELAALGINHFGDIDYHRGFIFAPLEKPAVVFAGIELSPGQSLIAVFDTDLELVSYVEITGDQGAKAGWLAIDPWTVTSTAPRRTCRQSSTRTSRHRRRSSATGSTSTT
jgi:hypothetical protein